MKKINKVTFLLIAAVIFIGASAFFGKNIINSYTNKVNVVASSNNEYNLSDYITDEVKNNSQTSTHFLCLTEEFTPQKMYELATDIAIVKVISKDYMDPEASMLGMTFGKMLVNTVISGNLNVGQVVTYEKPGGYVDLETWEKAQPNASTEKRRYLREKAGLSTDLSNEYINILIDSDVEIETGKTYLAYLTYDQSCNAYEIIGLENGLRELNIEQAEKSVSITNINANELKLKNNTTGEWEILNSYIKENIKRLQDK